MATRTKTLAVQNFDGRPITASIERTGEIVRVRTQPIPETIEDGTNNTPDGRLVFEVPASGYLEAIEKLEKYIESLMLRELGRSENENSNSSDKRRPDTRRAEKPTEPGSSAADPGEADPSVDSGRDGDEPPARPRKRRKPKTDVAEESDPSTSASSESRDEALPESREGNE